MLHLRRRCRLVRRARRGLFRSSWPRCDTARRAPVVAASGDLVGIVSTDDLLGIIAEQLGSLAHLLDRQTRSAAR